MIALAKDLSWDAVNFFAENKREFAVEFWRIGKIERVLALL